MKDHLIHADDEQLHQLLFGDEVMEGYQETLVHVETCQVCRERLDDLSGTGAFDDEARRMLDGYVPEVVPPTVDMEESIVSGYLGPPTHPEMLGRLGRYEIERVIGCGGMGVVLKGFDTELNRPVALKLLAKHLSHSGTARQRFAREAKAAAAVVHEHVVAIHNVEVEGDTPFLVMPFIAGESLQARVGREGNLGIRELLRIAIQAASGLQAAHDQGVIHRDIKPGNILLEGGVERALVTDFGLAQIVDEASLTHTGIVTGTPNYMSPEQALGKRTDPRSDLFSLGCVLYFMATGRPPFRAERALGVLNRLCHEPHTPVWQDQGDVPDRLSDLIDRLLEKNPAHRLASAREAQEEMQAILADLQNPGPRHLRIIRRQLRRLRASLTKPSFASVVAVSVGVLVFGCVGWLAHSLSEIQGQSGQPGVTTEAGMGAVVTEDSPKTSSATLPAQFTIDTWQQASAAESQQWDATIEELSFELDQIEQDLDGWYPASSQTNGSH